MAETLVWLTTAWDALPARNTMPKARAAAQRAVELEPRLSSAHAALGSVATYEWDRGRAESCFTEALRLNPNDALAHYLYAHSLMWLDTRFDEALRHARRAVDLDPLNPWWSWYSLAHYFGRDFDSAIAVAHQLIALEPLWGFGHYFLGAYLATAGRVTEGRASLEHAIELDGRGVHYVGWLGATLALTGREADAQVHLAELASHEHQGRDVGAWKLLIHACLGDADKVMSCLEEAYADVGLARLPPDSPAGRLPARRSRFEDLLRRMNLEHLASYRPQP